MNQVKNLLIQAGKVWLMYQAVMAIGYLLPDTFGKWITDPLSQLGLK